MIGVPDRLRSGTLWMTPVPRPVAGDDVSIVLDPAWTPDPAGLPGAGAAALRDTVDALLREVDPVASASALLDEWAARSGVVEAFVIGGTSFWYYVRIKHWQWLEERVLWAHLLRRLVEEHRPAAIACAPDGDPALLDVARLVAATEGLELRADDPGGRPGAVGAFPDTGAEPRPSRTGRLLGRIRRRLAGAVARPGPGLAAVEAQLARLAAEAVPRLLVVSTHAPQRVDAPGGPRTVNPYLGAVTDRLANSALDPIVLDTRLRLEAGATPWGQPAGDEPARTLPWDALRVQDRPTDPAVAARAERIARDVRASREPLVVAGIDLGPMLAREVADAALRWFPSKSLAVERIGRLLERLPVAGLLVADEYHRQDWMEAASRAGIRVAAIQHGVIHRHHAGYVHAARPPALRLPDRTYVFGRWERDLLVHGSVYRDEEVVVGGSPRLDATRSPATIDRAAVRAECGIAAGDRLLVVSGSWGGVARRFQYPAVLARLFDRPLPRVHLVVKLHPGEPDEGPYRAVVEGVAAARGFAAPPITVVQHIDLYRLLAAADAHLGIHSTVLTEAVFVGTPNLLAAGVQGGDLLGYVEAGVALPVTNGEDLLAALDAAAAGAITPEARAAFVARHYEPGSASDRIAADLLAWLSPTPPAPEEP